MNQKKEMPLNENILRGKYFPVGSRDRLKATLVNLTLLLATIIMIVDVYGSIVNNYLWMSIIEGSSAIIFLVTYILFFHTISLKNSIYIVLTVLSSLFIISLTIPGENPQLALFWLATLPIYIFFFVGTKIGAKWTIVIIFLLILTTLNTSFKWLNPLYDIEFLSQITLGYTAVSYLVLVLEKERYGFENKLVASIREKEVLYQELNHRVKNNLLMILSLVKLQISKSNSEQTKSELLVTKNRIDSISSLYESLHLDNNVNDISTYDYLSTLLEKIKPLTSKKISVTFNIRHDLPQNQLLYAGLILNELATNAFKYAYKDISDGTLHISIFKKEKSIYMTIKDNGIGYDISKTQSLGITIVETLVEKQLGGTVEVLSNHGTETILSWKENV